MTYYRPRMSAVLHCPVWGTSSERGQQANTEGTIRVPVRVSRASWTRNSHNYADELSITVDYRDAGVDPRLLGNATIEFFLGNADESGAWEPSKANRRFLGIVTSVRRALEQDSRSVEIEAQDFTSLMLQSKPYPPEGVPKYSDTLTDAWNLIVDHAGGKDVHGNWFRAAEALRGKVKPMGIDGWPPRLSGACGERIAKNAPIHVGQASDAWAVWQKAVGLLGLISWIDQDDVIVATASNYYTRADPPVLVYGKNILKLEEQRNANLSGKKIALVAYDPVTGRVVHALYPTSQDPKTTKKKSKAEGAAQKDDYEVFEFNGVTDQARLIECAKRVYEERSRQELTGKLTTCEMFIERASEAQFDLLTLGAGQDIRIELEESVMHGLRNGTESGMSEAQLVTWLTSDSVGYEPSVAELVARNAKTLDMRSCVFFTKSVTTTFEVDDTGGSFEIEIEYCNRIEGADA